MFKPKLIVLVIVVVFSWSLSSLFADCEIDYDCGGCSPSVPGNARCKCKNRNEQNQSTLCACTGPDCTEHNCAAGLCVCTKPSGGTVVTQAICGCQGGNSGADEIGVPAQSKTQVSPAKTEGNCLAGS